MKASDIRLAATGFLLIGVCYGLARFAFGLFLPEIRSNLQLSTTFSGLISGGAFVGYCLAIVASAELTERIGPRNVAVSAAAVAAVGLAAMAMSPSGSVLAAAVLFAGLSTGLASPPMAAAVDAVVDDQRKDFANTVVNAGASGGVALSGLVALFVGAGWRTAFAVFSAIALALTIGTFFVTPQRNAHGISRKQALPSLTTELKKLSTAAFLMGTASTVVWSFGGELARGAPDWSNRMNGFLWIVIGISGLTGAVAGRLIEWFGLNTVHRMFLALMAIAMICVAGPASTTIAFGGGSLFGAAYIMLTGVYLVWGVTALPDRPAIGLTIGFLAIAVGQSVGAPLFGLILGWFPAIAATAVFATVALAACVIQPVKTVIAHPDWAMASLVDAVASTRRRSSRTERWLALAVLTTERKAA